VTSSTNTNNSPRQLNFLLGYAFGNLFTKRKENLEGQKKQEVKKKNKSGRGEGTFSTTKGGGRTRLEDPG